MKLPLPGFDDSRARRLYPREESEDGAYWYGPYDYQPIIDSFGTVLAQADDDDYQGDSHALIEKDGRFGVLTFGWGSCSGCDALQATANYREIEELIVQIENGIRWFDTLAEAMAYVADDSERSGSYYCGTQAWEKFRDKVASLP